MVTSHPKCVVQSYLQWLKDSDYDSSCALCRTALEQGDCVRLICYRKCPIAPCHIFDLVLNTLFVTRRFPLGLPERTGGRLADTHSAQRPHLSRVRRSRVSAREPDLAGGRCAALAARPGELGPLGAWPAAAGRRGASASAIATAQCQQQQQRPAAAFDAGVRTEACESRGRRCARFGSACGAEHGSVQ